MLTSFEQFAVNSMMGASDTPPRSNGSLCFEADWQRTAFGLAIALSRDGLFEWEHFRQQLIAAIASWEEIHLLAGPTWCYYERWLEALLATLADVGFREDQIAGRSMPAGPTCR
jgi:nitrile hydratase accessory protein